jgi:hypothetical protein
MHPDAFDNLVATYIAFKDAYDSQPPDEPEVESEIRKIEIIGPQAFLIRAAAVQDAYNKFRKKIERPEWDAKWSPQHRNQAIGSAIESMGSDPQCIRAAFQSAVAALDEQPISFQVTLPIYGIDLNFPQVTIGTVRIFKADQSYIDSLKQDGQRYVDAMSDTSKRFLEQQQR